MRRRCQGREFTPGTGVNAFPGVRSRYLSVPEIAAPTDGTRRLLARRRDRKKRAPCYICVLVKSSEAKTSGNLDWQSLTIMIRPAILLVLAINLANGQLNYEGNPFTEYTEYIAEESDLSERRTARQNDDPASPVHPRKLYSIMETETEKRLQPTTEIHHLLSDKSQERQTPLRDAAAAAASGRQFHPDHHADQSAPIGTNAEVALNSFLNSKTPEESRLSLDHYLRSQQPPEERSHSLNAMIGDADRNEQSLVQTDAQSTIPQIAQRQLLLPRSEEQQVQLASQTLNPSRQLMSPVQDQRQQFLPTGQELYGYVEEPAVIQPAIRASPTGIVLRQGVLQPVPLMTSVFQDRNDMMTPALWRERMRRIRGKPFAFAQPKIAPGGLYKGPIAVPIKHNVPVEVIYTKPPGYGLHRRPPAVIGKLPPEDTWFPPSQKDVLYSQLYAQSYDPHYYNYIAATGKIRPQLYGKLGKKRQEEQDDGIWWDLYRGFKQHGLKNLMTPTFLLGMTLPVVTLMLSALVQKRSIARSDDQARQLDQEDALRDYLEKLQRAMECYAGRSPRGDSTKLDGC